MKSITSKVDKDLEAGKFGLICSNETNFKNYITKLFTEFDEYYKKKIRLITKKKTIKIANPPDVKTQIRCISAAKEDE